LELELEELDDKELELELEDEVVTPTSGGWGYIIGGCPAYVVQPLTVLGGPAIRLLLSRIYGDQISSVPGFANGGV
jgi:hypothetical protein